MTTKSSNPFAVRVMLTKAPSWWSAPSFLPGTWTLIAGPETTVGKGGHLAPLAPAAAANFPATTASHASLLLAWTGACVDQGRKEYLLCANGGHFDYGGNELYGLRLSLDDPRWVRLCEPTPLGPSVYPAVAPGPTPHPSPHLSPPDVGMPWTWIDANYDGTPDSWAVADNFQQNIAAAVFGDGRSRAMHTAGYQQYVDGRIWFPIQNSVTSSAGGTRFSTVSLDRNETRQILGDAVPGTSPPAYDPTVNPWRTDYGKIGNLAGDGGYALGFSLSALDPQRKEIWSCPSSYEERRYFVTRTSPYSTETFNQPADWSWYPGGFLVCAYDPGVRLLVCGIRTRNEIYVKKLDDDTATFDRVVLPDDGFNWDPAGRWKTPDYGNKDPVGVDKMPSGTMSSCYHSASKSILLCEPNYLGGCIRRLRIPMSGGAYDPAGAWQWETLGAAFLPAPAGTPPQGMVGVGQGTYTKCQMIEDMGDGQAALVYVESTGGPTYVFKVP